MGGLFRRQGPGRAHRCGGNEPAGPAGHLTDAVGIILIGQHAHHHSDVPAPVQSVQGMAQAVHPIGVVGAVHQAQGLPVHHLHAAVEAGLGDALGHRLPGEAPAGGVQLLKNGAHRQGVVDLVLTQQRDVQFPPFVADAAALFPALQHFQLP